MNQPHQASTSAAPQALRSETHSANREQQPTPRDTALAAVRAAIDQKGLDVRALDLSDVTDIADYFVIVSGTSDRHVQGITDKIREELRRHGEQPVGTSGYETAEWILLDYGDVVIHVFYEPTRQYYAFDELWRDAKPLELEPELERETRRLRTGVIK